VVGKHRDDGLGKEGEEGGEKNCGHIKDFKGPRRMTGPASRYLSTF
jgi:hypothetical protein